MSTPLSRVVSASPSGIWRGSGRRSWGGETAAVVTFCASAVGREAPHTVPSMSVANRRQRTALRVIAYLSGSHSPDPNCGRKAFDVENDLTNPLPCCRPRTRPRRHGHRLGAAPRHGYGVGVATVG